MHVVGLYIRYDAPAFRAKLQSFVDSRINRNMKMCANLQSAGIDITYQKLCEENPGKAHASLLLSSIFLIRCRARIYCTLPSHFITFQILVISRDLINQ